MKIPYSILQIQSLPEGHKRYQQIRARRFESLPNDVSMISLIEENYKVVYEDSLSCECDTYDIGAVLNKLYYVFNMEHPSGFKGHSLSVSDIVRVEDKYYHCQSCGWKEIGVR